MRNMHIFMLVLSFIAGLVSVVLFAALFSVKTKGIIRLVINSAAGAVLLITLTLCRVLVLPVNALSVLTVGFLGVPGLIAVALITLF